MINCHLTENTYNADADAKDASRCPNQRRQMLPKIDITFCLSTSQACFHFNAVTNACMVLHCNCKLLVEQAKSYAEHIRGPRVIAIQRPKTLHERVKRLPKAGLAAKASPF
jgi:hypothetical protein